MHVHILRAVKADCNPDFDPLGVDLSPYFLISFFTPLLCLLLALLLVL
jgi:hypothetical protein